MRPGTPRAARWQAEYARRYNQLVRLRPDPDSICCPHPYVPPVDVKVGAPFAVPATVALSKLSELLREMVVVPIAGRRRAA